MQVYETVRPYFASAAPVRAEEGHDSQSPAGFAGASYARDSPPSPQGFAGDHDETPTPTPPPAAPVMVPDKTKTSRAMLFEFISFVFAGLLLILILEQFIQIGAGIRPY